MKRPEAARGQALGKQPSAGMEGQGSPVEAISKLVNKSEADLLVMGSHGHRALKDLLFGATVDAVRHRVKVPVLVVK